MDDERVMGCLSLRSQCGTSAPAGYQFALYDGSTLALCIQDPAVFGASSCDDVMFFEGIELYDSDGTWLGCTTAETTGCPVAFPQWRTQNSACQEVAQTGRRRVRR
jgi:hypothetical protein